MKIVNLPGGQGSPEWLAWRKSVITATDASIILGSNPWETPYTLWQRKLGLIEEKTSNEAMERGKRLEPIARTHFNDRYNVDMQPVIIESSEYEFLGASLDGISPFGETILEIKCGGAKLHAQACEGEIPLYYMHQMQHQLLVTGAKKCFYYSFDGKEGLCLEVKPDPEFSKEFLPKARAFLKCMAFQEAPPLQDKDYKDMSNDISWEMIAVEYKNCCDMIKRLEDSKEYYRKKLLIECGDQNCMGSGIKVMKVVTRGRISYDEIPELKGLDLDKYRKPASTSWKILTS